MTMIVATKECWSEILAAFLEFGFIQKELEFQLSQESQNRYEVIFSKKLFTELRASSEKRRDDMDKFLDLDARFDSEPMNGHCKIITRKGCEDLAIIQFAMAITISRLKAEKRKRIEDRKIMLNLELEDAIKNHKYFGYKKADIFYKKSDFYVKFRFSRRDGCIKKIPKPWKNKKLFSPEGILEEFKAYLDTLL